MVIWVLLLLQWESSWGQHLPCVDRDRLLYGLYGQFRQQMVLRFFKSFNRYILQVRWIAFHIIWTDVAFTVVGIVGVVIMYFFQNLNMWKGGCHYITNFKIFLLKKFNSCCPTAIALLDLKIVKNHEKSHCKINFPI